MALAEGDGKAAAVLVLLPGLPLAAWIGMRGILGHPQPRDLVAVFVVFVCAANFRVRDYADKSIDFQVALKLLALVLAVGICVLHIRKLERFVTVEVFCWIALFAILVGSSSYAMKPSFAAITSFSFVVAFAYMFYLAAVAGRTRTVEIMIFVVTMMSVASLAVYWAVPSFGRMQAWTGEEFGTIGRLRGITGSANSIGSTAAFGILLSVLYYRDLSVASRRIALLTIGAAALCVILSENRMSIIALIVGLWFWFVFRGDIAGRAVMSLLLGLVAGIALLGFSDQIFALMSRSGDASEITSATGRAEIWAVALEFWSRKPLLGYGYASALSILPNDPRLFGVAAHTHNLYMEMLFSTGLVGITMFAIAMLVTVRKAIAAGAVREMALVLFFLVRGLTEASPLSGMAGYATFAFSLGIVLILTVRPAEIPRVTAKARGAGFSLSPGTSVLAPGSCRVAGRD